MTVTAADEALHEPGPEPLWNESWYFDAVDPEREVGIYFRLGRYPNRAQTWLHLGVAGRGRPLAVLVDQVAPLSADGVAHQGAEWSAVTRGEPLGQWQVTLQGSGRQFVDPMAATRERVGLEADGHEVPIKVDLEWEPVGDPYHYQLTTRYEVSCHVRGTVQVGEQVLVFDGPGQRDHSWGVRDWWAFGWCWSAGALGDGTAFHVADIRFPGGSAGFGYVLEPGGTPVRATTVRAEDRLDADDLPVGARLGLEPGGLVVDVTPVALVPVAFVADDGRVARMIRALCRYETNDGRVGAGWTEWNQLRDPTRSERARL